MKISVVIASYTQNERIIQQVNSIKSQTKKPDEIIISESCNVELIDKLLKVSKIENIKIINFNSNAKIINQRVSENFINGINNANGDYIFLSDQDDLWDNTKIEYISNYLNEYDLIISNARVISAEKKILSKNYMEFANFKHSIFNTIFKNRVLGCTMAFKKNIFDEIFFKPIMPYAHDQYIYLLFKINNKKILIDERPLMSYIRYDDSITISKIKILKIHKIIIWKIYSLINASQIYIKSLVN